tara:strand:- start:765 stop:1625 length:861 start_codon:yes stop_codon:yes gene_type:complete
MDLKDNIINKFKNVNFNEKYSNDITITIVLIILTFFVTIYFLILGTIKSQKTVWKNNKCNPLFMPFASIINDKYDENGEYNASFTEDNFNECLNELNYEVGNNFKTPMDSMLNFIMGIFIFASGVVNQIFSFLLYIFSLILELFKLLMGYIKELVNKTNVILQNFMALINYILDSFEVIKLTIIYLLEFLKCGFFLLATSFSAVFVLPSITSFIILSVVAAIAMLLAIIFSWFPPVGVPLAGNAVVTRVFALLMGIIMIFCIVLHKSLSRQTKRAFKTSSLFNSSC